MQSSQAKPKAKTKSRHSEQCIISQLIEQDTSGQQETLVSHMIQYFRSPKNWVVWYKCEMF